MWQISCLLVASYELLRIVSECKKIVSCHVTCIFLMLLLCLSWKKSTMCKNATQELKAHASNVCHADRSPCPTIVYPYIALWCWRKKAKEIMSLFYNISSYIRYEDFLRPSSSVTLRGPPLDSETAGQESSGQRLISSIGKTKRIAFLFYFFSEKKIFSKISDFLKKKWFFWIFQKVYRFSFFFKPFL